MEKTPKASQAQRYNLKDVRSIVCTEMTRAQAILQTTSSCPFGHATGLGK